MGTWSPGPGPTSGDDTFVGIDFHESADGGDGNDTLTGRLGNDTLIGGNGNDVIDGGDSAFVGGHDSIFGGAGDDILIARDDEQEFQEVFDGGDDFDTLSIFGSVGLADTTVTSIERITFTPDPFSFLELTAQQVLSGLSSSTIVEVIGTLPQFIAATFYISSDINSPVTLDLSNWTIIGNVEMEIHGGAQNDLLVGTSTADKFFADAGADTMVGGDGGDTYYVDDIGDVVDEGGANVGAGDRVRTTLPSFTLGANVETLTLEGAISVSGVGNALNNIIGADTSNGVSLSGLGGDDQIYGSDHNDTLEGGTGNDLIIGNAGNDTISGDDGDDTLYGFMGDDTLSGGIGNDVLTGDVGADQINGGNGIDTVSYSTSSAAVRINLAAGVGLDSEAQGDTYIGIENAIGSEFDDRFTGSTGANRFNGGAGNDTALGQNGNDVLEGEAGNDVLRGDAGNDILNGGNNDDMLVGGAGADVLNGDAGVDTADYSASSGAVRVNLASLQGLDNDAQGDTFNSIEIVIGSKFDDRFTGSANGDTFRGGLGVDTLLGQNGNDALDGGGGADVLNGGNNDDILTGGAGADQLAGGTGIDIIDYSASAGGVRVNISANLGLDNDAQGDTFNSVEGVIGSAFNDRFTGATQFGDNFRGGDGDDTLLGQAGNDQLFGEAGNDTLTGGANDDLLNGGLGADALNGGAGLDAFVFADVLGAGNIDAIAGFSVADDVIHLGASIFGGAAGTLAASAFTIGAAAVDADDRIIYNSVTGALFYDADGDGAEAAVQFATLSAGLALTNADFFGFDS